MPLRLKIALVVLSCLWSACACAADNYSAIRRHRLVDELVQEQVSTGRTAARVRQRPAPGEHSHRDCRPAERANPGMNTGRYF